MEAAVRGGKKIPKDAKKGKGVEVDEE